MICCLLFCLIGCNTGPKESPSAPINGLSPYPLIEWWELVYFHVAKQRIKPPVASRIYAYLGIAIYQSAVHGMEGYISLEGQVNGLKNLPQPDDNLEYDWPTVIHSTLYLVVDELLSRSVHADENSFLVMRDKHLENRRSVISTEVFERSTNFGTRLSESLVEWIKEDQFDDTRFNTFYKLPSRIKHPERWEPTDINVEACEPYWSTLRPFVLQEEGACHTPPAINFSDDKESPFAEMVEEILEYDKNLTEEERDIALHWADDPGETATPPGHWTYIMNYAIKQSHLDMEQASAMYALTGIGIADAFIASWYSKYRVNLVRPKTFIRENYSDKKGWEPLVETPPFPEYTSAHAAVSQCAADILEGFLGADYTLTDSTHFQIGLDPRLITSFDAAAKEAGYSRLYGGIHYRFSIEAGFEQGSCVSARVLERIQLKNDDNQPYFGQ